jgi:hypothetical protein
LTENFVGAKTGPTEPEARERDAWRQRYHAAIEKIKKAGIDIRSDIESGAEDYIKSRTDWNCFVRRLAPFMDYNVEEVDRVTPPT